MNGGQTRVTPRGYVAGCPQLVCEVSSSTASYDLHAKRLDYERYGAIEYVTIVVGTPAVVWFRRGKDRLIEVPPDADGVYRSRTFPGLWLDPAALLAGELDLVATRVDQGVDTPAHAAFREKLAARTA